jgi:glycosyltransferase involved in cell wall biosynthesis
MTEPTGARVIVDARPLLDPDVRDRGIGRYVAELLRALQSSGSDTVAAVAAAQDVAAIRARGISGPVEVLRPASVGGDGPAWWVATAMFLGGPSFDPVPSIVTDSGCRVAALIYDVIPFRHPDRYQQTAASRAFYTLRASIARSADVYAAISRFSALTATQHLHLDPDRVHVIGAGVGDSFVTGPGDTATRAGLGIDAEVRVVVAVTGGDDRKNTLGLLRAWARVPVTARHRTVLAVVADVPPAMRSRWRAHTAELGLLDVVFTGHLTDHDLVALLRGAVLAVMPSLDEGFGLPVLEAAACGTAVITSGVSALPEVLDLPEAIFDPHDPDAIAAAIDRALTDDAWRAQLRQAGAAAVLRWTWPRVAADLRATMQGSGGGRRAAVDRRRRMALLGPFAGSPSGIGAYNERVASALEATGAEVVRLVETSGTSLAAGPGRWPAHALGRAVSVNGFDHVVASLGSSANHLGALAALEQGVHLWMHEPSLIGLHVGRAHLSRSPAWGTGYLRGQIASNEGDEALHRMDQLGAPALMDPAAYRRLGIRLIAEPVRKARSVIVSSVEAAAAVQGAHPEAKVLVLPLAFPMAFVERREPPVSARIVAFGWLGLNKQSTRLLDVLQLLGDDVVVDFVGPEQRAAGEAVRTEAARRGLTGRVVFHGRLEGPALDEVLDRARAALQLRAGDGEMSGAIADLTARGVPVVTTLETTAIYGDGIAAVLPSDTMPPAVGASVRPLIEDDDAWRQASDRALSLARSWTFGALTGALMSWLDASESLDAGCVRIAGPPPERPHR